MYCCHLLLVPHYLRDNVPTSLAYTKQSRLIGQSVKSIAFQWGWRKLIIPNDVCDWSRYTSNHEKEESRPIVLHPHVSVFGSSIYRCMYVCSFYEKKTRQRK